MFLPIYIGILAELLYMLVYILSKNDQIYIYVLRMVNELSIYDGGLRW